MAWTDFTFQTDVVRHRRGRASLRSAACQLDRCGSSRLHLNLRYSRNIFLGCVPEKVEPSLLAAGKHRQLLWLPAQNFDVISVLVTEELETVLIGPKWTQNEDHFQPSKEQAIDYRSDVGWKCPGRAGDPLLAKQSRYFI
jgi:hypothetical protein